MNPPCNSLLATFFEFNFENCQIKASSCSNTPVHPKRTFSQSFELLFRLPLLMPLKRRLLQREVRTVRWEVQRDHLKKATFERSKLVRREMWRTKTLMLLVPLTRSESLDTSLRDSRSQSSSVERDLRRSVCPRVSLTPLNSQNVSFQIFNS